MSEGTKSWRRRGLGAAVLASVATWVIMAPRLQSLFPSKLNFRGLPDLPPFRELEGSGAVSTAGAAFVGLDRDTPRPPDFEAAVADVRADPCRALFGSGSGMTLPIAFFSDYNCPNCRVLDAILTDYDAAHPGTVTIIRHELPLLGPASIIASKAALAADRQGGYLKMHKRLIRSRLVTDLSLVSAIAESAGLDGQKLIADMASPEIARTLLRSSAIAAVFGFYGTPATVFGRTVVMGAVPPVDVQAIIAAERALARPRCKAS